MYERNKAYITMRGVSTPKDICLRRSDTTQVSHGAHNACSHAAHISVAKGAGQHKGSGELTRSAFGARTDARRGAPASGWARRTLKTRRPDSSGASRTDKPTAAWPFKWAFRAPSSHGRKSERGLPKGNPREIHKNCLFNGIRHAWDSPKKRPSYCV